MRPLRTLALAAGLVAASAALQAEAADGPPDAGYADLVARLLPEVVSVSVRLATPVSNGAPGAGTQTRDSGMVVEGSGFIIDPSGYILTNRHVIVGSYSVTVTLSDGTRLTAHVVGRPPATDIALLKVDPARPLPAVTFGNSDDVRVGDKVLAIGNPKGVGETVTTGIVSARNRDIQDTPYDNYLQTDASINHGNSGGPLFDVQGRVIGVNTALLTSSATDTGSIGLGFAIPSDDVWFAADELRRFGRVRPGWIGARLEQVTPDLADAFGLPTTGGAIVAAIDTAGPASAAGLNVGDVITSFDDKTPPDARALMRMIAEAPLGSTAALTVRRGDASVAVSLPVEEYPPAAMAANFPFQLSDPPPLVPGDLGLRLAPLDPSVRSAYHLTSDRPGAEIATVLSGSAADRAGLRGGDVILQVQQARVSEPDDIERSLQAAAQARRSRLALLVMNAAGQHWVALPVASVQ